MECKDAQEWMIDSSSEDKKGKKKADFHNHISRCLECRNFWNDLRKIRMHMRERPGAVPTEELLERTRVLCYTRLSIPTPSSAVPKHIWMAFAVLVILTGVLMLPFTRELRLGQPLSLQAIGVLILMIQNAAMLFFTPVLIRKFNPKRRPFT